MKTSTWLFSLFFCCALSTQAQTVQAPYVIHDLCFNPATSALVVAGKTPTGEGIFQYQTGVWSRLSPKIGLVDVEYNPNGNTRLLVRDHQGSIFQWNGTQWSGINGKAIDVSTSGTDGRYYMVNKTDRKIYFFSSGKWLRVSGLNHQAKAVAVANNGTIYYIRPDGTVWSYIKGASKVVSNARGSGLKRGGDGQVYLVSSNRTSTGEPMLYRIHGTSLQKTGFTGKMATSGKVNSRLYVLKNDGTLWYSAAAGKEQQINRSATDHPKTADPNGDTDLHKAARAGNTSEMVKLFDEGIDINAKNNKGETPLFDGVRTRKTYVTQLLLDKGADLSLKNNAGKTVLVVAVEQNDIASAQILLDRGADANDGNPLNAAIKANNIAMVTALLNRYADPGNGLEEAANQNNVIIFKTLIEKGARCKNNRPFDIAMLKNNDEIVQMALANGTDAEKAIDMAISKNRAHIVQMCLQQGAQPLKVIPYAVQKNHEQLLDVTLAHYGGNANEALAIAAREKKNNLAAIALANGADPNLVLAEMSGYGWPDMVDLLLSYEANPNAGMGPAIQNNHTVVVRQLVAYGAQVNQPEYMATAAGRGNTEIVRLLLDGGADANPGMEPAIYAHQTPVVEILMMRGADGTQPAFIAAAAGKGNDKVVGLLLDSGADANYGLVPALKNKKRTTARTLIEHGVDYANAKYLQAASFANDIGNAELLLQKGAVAENGMHPAIVNGNIPMLDLLVKYGADQTKEAHVITAIKYKNGSVLNRLIKAGAPVSYVAADGKTLLHMASKTGSVETAKVLLGAGLDPNAKATNGYTALHFAMRHRNHISLAEMLLDHGCNVNAVNNDGCTPLMLAKGAKLRKFIKRNGGRKYKK